MLGDRPPMPEDVAALAQPDRVGVVVGVLRVSARRAEADVGAVDPQAIARVRRAEDHGVPGRAIQLERPAEIGEVELFLQRPLRPDPARAPRPSAVVGAEHEPVDAFIRRSGKAAVRGQTEMVNGSACYVIDAPTEEGQLTVWIDPAHGYHVAKAMMVQKEGHKVHGEILPRGHKEQCILTNVSFKQVNKVWVPVESTYEADIMRPPDSIMSGKTHSKITEFLIDPDHEALRSFEVNDFPEGTRTSYMDNGRLLPVWYIWKNGGPVPDTEKTRGRSR